MQRLSREELFASLPGPKRRKKLSKTVLGLVWEPSDPQAYA